MKKLLFILLVIGFSAFKASAQNPGYMGKHIVISAEGTFSGSIFLMQKTWLKYGTTIEIVSGKKHSLGLGYLYNSTKFPYQSFQHGCYKYYKDNSKLISHSIGIDYYKYFGGSIAPLGDFFRLRLFYMFSKSDDFYSNRVLNSDPSTCYSNEASFDSYDNFGTSIYFGRKRIFYDMLAVSYGFKLGVVLVNPYFSNPIDIYDRDVNLIENYGSYENFYSTLISLDVSIGFVL